MEIWGPRGGLPKFLTCSNAVRSCVLWCCSLLRSNSSCATACCRRSSLCVHCSFSSAPGLGSATATCRGDPGCSPGSPTDREKRWRAKGPICQLGFRDPFLKENKLLTGSSYTTGPSSPLQAVRLVQLWAPGLLCWLSVDHMTAAPPEPAC